MRPAVHAEWTKLRTVAGPAWLTIALIAITIGVSALTTAIVKCPASCDASTAKLSLTGIVFGQAAAAAIAVLAVTAEYSCGMITTSLLATPRRTVLLAAKAIVVTTVVLAAGVVSVLGSLLAGWLLLPGNGFTAANKVASWSPLRGLTLQAGGLVLAYLVLVGLFTLGVATLVRDSAAATSVVLGLMFGVPLIAAIGLSPTWQHRLDEWAPMSALPAAIIGHAATAPAGDWPGLAALGFWTAAVVLAGWLVLRLRDA
jgi:ABC-2 type transport system permease protein